MKKLTRYKKTPSAKLLWTLGFNTFIAVVVLFWVEVFIEQPLLHQFLYLFAFVLLRFFHSGIVQTQNRLMQLKL